MNKVLFLIFITISLQAQSKDITLVLPWKHQFQFSGYYVAKEMGYYKKAGLNVNIKEYDLKRDNTKDVALGRYEFGVGHSSLILDILNKKTDIILLNAIHQSSPFVLVSNKRDDIKSLHDIVGKKIMMSRDQTTTASINAMLFSEHVKQNSYEILDTSFNIIDLANGNTDFMASFSSNEPFALKEKGIEATIFDPKDYGYNFYSDLLFTSEIFLKNNKKNVDAFRDASLKGWEYEYEHIDETVELILKKYNTQGRTKEALHYEANTLKKLAFKGNVNFGNINLERVETIINTYRLLGLVNPKAKVDFKNYVYNTSSEIEFNQKSLNRLARDYFEFFNNFYFRVFIFVSLLIILIGLYFSSRMDRLLKKKTKQLELQNKIFDKNICSSKTDINGYITHVSEAFLGLTGYTRDELISHTHNILRDTQTPQKIYKDLWMTISSGHSWKGEIKNKKKDGSSYWVNAIISPIFNNDKNVIAYESIVQDVTLKKVLLEFNEKLESEVKKQTKKLEILAITDKLTGLYNRVKLDDELASNYKYFEEFSENFSMIIIDIDHFKNVNDTHGHQIGDTVLTEIAKLLKRSVRSTDIVGRWGGEEFMIICPKTDIEHAYAIAENIRKEVESYKFSRVGQITVCAGISEIVSNKNLDAMVSKADTLLYDAKHNGRNIVKG